MTAWTAEVKPVYFSRVMGLHKYSTQEMKNAIRHVLHAFPKGFSRSSTVSQPLGSEQSSKVVVQEHDDKAIPSFPAAVLPPCAVIDTGCQRSAIGRKTLNHLAKHLPPELDIRFRPKGFRFSGISAVRQPPRNSP